MAKPTVQKRTAQAELVRVLINALVEAGEYDLADAVWARVKDRVVTKTKPAGARSSGCLQV